MRKVLFCLVSLIIYIDTISAYILPEVFFDSSLSRTYLVNVIPFQEFFLTKKCKTVVITSFENDFIKKNKTTFEPSIYHFDELGKITSVEINSDSVVETVIKFYYDNNNYLKEVIKNQYSYNNLVSENKISLVRKTMGMIIEIISSSEGTEEQISNEKILISESSIKYTYNDSSFENTDQVYFDQYGNISRIDHKSLFLLVRNSEPVFSSFYFKYDSNKLIDYRKLNDKNEIEFIYSFHYDCQGFVDEIVETDFTQNNQYKRIYNFLKNDENGNWLIMRKDIYRYDEKISEYFIERDIEYW